MIAAVNGTLSSAQLYTLSILNTAAGCASVVGALTVIILHVYLGFTKSPGIRLVLYMAVCDLIAGAGHSMFNLPNQTPICTAQGFIFGLAEPLSFYCMSHGTCSLCLCF